jgi:hypothetical protein
MRRKGEPSPAAVDRGWPHQVAVPAKISLGENYNVVHSFCEGLSLCSRGHSVVGPDNEWWNVFCFAEKEHAEKFKQRFGGEWFGPAKRGKGQSWTIWNR